MDQPGPVNGVDEPAVQAVLPRFQPPLHVGRPNIGAPSAFLERVAGILDRRWLTNNGEVVQEFEHRLATYLGVKHCIAVSSGTTGLELAVRALRLHGEVIMPSFTFVAGAHALMLQGIRPVFCDVRPDTHLLDLRQLEALVTPRTTGVLGVHLWGEPCHVGELCDWASSRGLRVLFDAAHAFGCSWNGRKIGGFGAAEVFSFHATKVLNTLEGGAVTTDNDDVAAEIRSTRNFGLDTNGLSGRLGTNGKMNEVEAAMGLVNLDHVDDFIRVNRDNHAAYAAGLEGVPGVSLIRPGGSGDRNWQYVVVTIDPFRAGLDRDALLGTLHAHGILARRHFWPGCHDVEPYRSQFPLAPHSLPATELVAARVLCLPTGTSVSVDDVAGICAVIRSAVAATGTRPSGS